MHAEVARLSAALNQATVIEAEKDEEILHLKTTPPEFASFFVANSRICSGSFLLLMSLVEFRVNSFLWLLVLDLSAVLTPEGVMADDAAAPSVGVSRPRPSSSPVPLFKDVSGGVIHADFFPFSAGRYYATYPQDGVAENCVF
ncbi:hypothetical protein Tco_0280212, partial [Tanacetum coccineum]